MEIRRMEPQEADEAALAGGIQRAASAVLP